MMVRGFAWFAGLLVLLAFAGSAFAQINMPDPSVINGQAITYTNLSESKTDETISVHNVKLDVLSRGDRFDLKQRVAVRS